jgi:hypothetical protein
LEKEEYLLDLHTDDWKMSEKIMTCLYDMAGVEAQRDLFCNIAGTNMAPECTRFYSAATDAFAHDWEKAGCIDVFNSPW